MSRASDRGALALLLHAHMPYVEGFDRWPFGEEWLWEALATVYLPLTELLADAPVTLGLTPVLCDQLETLGGEPGDRFARFLREIRAPIHAEDAAGLDDTGEPVLAAEVRRASGDYAGADQAFERLGRDPLAAFARLEREGPLEIWTSAATHAVLPLLATDAGIRLQAGTGVASHERRFGGWSGGFWLPECAYRPGLERDLAEHGVEAFCVDQSGGWGLGALNHLEPVSTAAGPVALPIDWQTVELVWGPHGYPASPAYRDYHGRTLHDLKPWSIAGEPYRRDAALALAREHARDFVGRVGSRLDAYRHERRRPGLVCCALDAELIGHWWYEGTDWLRFVLDEARVAGLELVTLPAALEAVEPVERPLAASAWGRPKDLSIWDSPRVAEFPVRARRAELRTLAAASRPGARGPALERAARELLALQASDWAFQATHELAADYPQRRVRGHEEQLDAALGALKDSRPAQDASLRNLAPNLDLTPLLI
jgi:1,4-alpha-glucan branching enzyme